MDNALIILGMFEKSKTNRYIIRDVENSKIELNHSEIL